MPRSAGADDVSNVYKRLSAGDLSHAASDFSTAFTAMMNTHASRALERGRAHACALDAFTQLSARGLLSPPTQPPSNASHTPSTSQIKLSTWCRSQFDTFLDLNMHLLATPTPTPREPELRTQRASNASTSLMDAKTVALSTWVTCMVACTPHPARFTTSLLTRFLRTLLTATDSSVQVMCDRWSSATWGAAAAASTDRSSSATGAVNVLPVADVLRALDGTLTAFRSSYVDEYDDVRFYTLRVLAELCTSLGARAVHGDAGVEVVNEGGETAAQVDLNAFASRCVEFLLSIALPRSQEEWDTASHDSMIAQYAAEHGGDAVVEVSEDEGDAAHDAENAATASTVEAPGDAAVSSMPDVRSVGAGAARRKRVKGVVNEAEAAAAWRKKPRNHVREKLIDYGEDAEKEEEEGAEQGTDVAMPVAIPETAAHVDAAGTPRYSSFASVRRAYAHAWVCLLQLPLPQAALTRVLLSLPASILPHMPHPYPRRLADFLTAAYTRGGSHALLSLHSLFILMTQHGLEYPRFYASLYALLTPATMHARYRARFFTLLDMFMSSSALPSYLVAAFMKRCARLSLTAPTPAVLYLLAFIHNCCARHPSVTILLHRARVGSSGSWPAPADAFNASVDDPAASHALDSSLWELTALAQHYFAPVCHAVRAIMKDGALATAAHSLAGTTDRGATPFASSRTVVTDVKKVSASTYHALVQEEAARRVRKAGETDMTLPDVPFAFTYAAMTGPDHAADAGDDASGGAGGAVWRL